MSEGILIVDDNASARKATRSYLVEKGFYVCGEAVNGRDAIDKAKELKPALVLLDVAMPEMNGVEAASRLRTQLLGVRIVLLTMYSEALDSKGLAATLGVDAVVPKADSTNDLERCVRRLLARNP